MKSHLLIDIYVYFYNQILNYGINGKLKNETIDFVLPDPYNGIHHFMLKSKTDCEEIKNNENCEELISYYVNLILEIFRYIIYNLDEESFERLLRKFKHDEYSYLKMLDQNIPLKVITKLGIYVYYLYLESEELFDKNKKDILKKMINRSILINDSFNKYTSFSKLLNETIQSNIEGFIPLMKNSISSRDNLFDHFNFSWELRYESGGKYLQLPDRVREFYVYFLIINYQLLWKESTKEALLKNFTLSEIYELLTNWFDIEHSSLKGDYLNRFQQLLDLFSIPLNRGRENISMFINDLGNYYKKEEISKKLKSFYDEKGNLKKEIKDKLNIIKEKIVEDIKKLFSEDVYHAIGEKKDTIQDCNNYNLPSVKIPIPIDIIPEISENYLSKAISDGLYSNYLRGLKEIFEKNLNLPFYTFNPYNLNQIELQKIKEKLELLKDECGINTAILSTELRKILQFQLQDNIFSDIFEEFEILFNKNYQDFTLFLNKDNFYLNTKTDVKIHQPIEEDIYIHQPTEDIYKCINNDEGEIKLFKKFSNSEEDLKIYCKLSNIYILIDIELNICMQKLNGTNCGAILIEEYT